MKYLIFDTNNLFCRIFSKHDKQKVIILESLKEIDRIIEKYSSEDHVCYFCFDNPESRIKWRSEIDDEYKKNRPKHSPKFYECLKNFKKILYNRYDEYKLIAIGFAEADDLTKPIISNIRLNDKKSKILLISDDLDWSRNMSIEGDIYWLSKHIVINNISFEAQYGFSPDQYSVQMWKTLRGDQSDHIPVGVRASGDRDEFNFEMFEIIKKCKNVTVLLRDFNKLDISEKTKQKIFKNKERLKKNWNLVEYMKISKELLNENMLTTKRNERVLELVYKRYGIKWLEVEVKEKEKDFDFFSLFGKCPYTI